ncbi:response regulator [Caulobacter hibisci]|uniref:histidine kinase n=2 Tax=Caulobacter hibisci TaxID=2035993 RepID=A0ABS0SXC7_9CAUL|nr:response regulator [Caulobacter hibisci]
MLVDASDRRAYERDLIAEREHAQEAAARLRESEAKLRELNETLERRVAERSAELETAYEQLRQSQKLEAMGSLTGGVAHDFNNLLTPILGGLDMLQRRGLEDARAPRIIAGALASAERARTLVHRLLAFARRQPLRPVAVDLAELVSGMRELLLTTLGPQVRLDLAMEPDLPHALADANQIEMALLNLAVNARDAMPGGGALTIAARRQAPPADIVAAPGDFLRLSVIDTGVGMDAATLARAVEPFFSTKGAGHGTGLGLSMVHGLAEQLGGKLRLESRPGQGARVDLWLPVAEAPALGDPAPAPAVGHLASGAVLLVDDEALVRAATADMLVDLGYRVVQAASAADALSMLEDGFEPDLLVTDHLMPGMSGTDLARQILTKRDLPVLIVSGYADVDAIAPDIARLSKPFRRDDLAAALVAARSSRREPGARRAAS